MAPLEIAFWRAAIAALLFGAHAAATGGAAALRRARPDLPAFALFGLVGIGVFYGAYQLAVRSGGAAVASVLLYTAPAWVALLARVVLGERLGGRKLVAVGLTLAGVALVATAGGGAVRVGVAAVAWGLLSGFTYALHYLFGRRYFAAHATPTVFAVALPVGALGLLPFVPFADKSPAAWAAILFSAVVPTYGAYLLYAAGLRRVEATRAATLATLEPVVAAVAAYAFFGEQSAPLAYLGSAVGLAGVVMAASGRTTSPGS